MKKAYTLLLIIATVILMASAGFCENKIGNIDVPLSEYDFRIGKLELNSNFDMNLAKEELGKFVKADGFSFANGIKDNVSLNDSDKYDKMILSFEKGRIGVIGKKIQFIESRKRNLKTPRQIAPGCSYGDVLKAYGISDSEKDAHKNGMPFVTKGKAFECYYSYKDVKEINFQFDGKGTLTTMMVVLEI
ncbi:MAG: hypothetical protein MJ234_02800 [bacterium]|nr:hypothetical protein [bacterium]